MEEKIKYGMSPFWKDVLWFLFWLGMALVSWFVNSFINFDYYPPFLWFIRIILGIIVLVKVELIGIAIENACGIAYRIIVTDDSWKRYKAKVFRPRFLFLIWSWAPIEKKYESWEGKNLFGGPTYEGYSYEKQYKTEDEAREAIEEYKRTSRRDRQDYMSKTKKKRKIKIIKV